MDRVKRHLYFLRYISSIVNSNQRRYLLEKASVDEITTLSEIAYNILGGVFTLSESELMALQRHKLVLRTLAANNFKSVKRELL